MTTNKPTRYEAKLDSISRVWRAAFEASPELQDEFVTVENFIAFNLNEPKFKALARRYETDCAVADDLTAFAVAAVAGRAHVLNS